MKKNESNGDEARYQTTDSSIEADATVAKKDIPKMRIAIGLAIGAAVGVGIGLLVGRKLDFGPLPSAAKAKVTTIESVKSATALPEAHGGGSAPQILKQVNVDWFHRKLPANQNASSQALAYAESLGVNLAEDETIVRPQTRFYKQAA